MKISRVECLPVHSGWRKNFVFVRLETDAGVVGWGEAYSQYDRDRAIAAQVEELGRYLIGRDAFHIRHILQIAFDDYAQRRGSLEFYCATSGIEQALWDIAGKVTRQPVYNLLGGPCRSRVRVYANGWSYKMQSPDDYARAAEAVCRRGFTAMKFDPLPGPWRTFIPKDHIGRAARVMRAVRNAVGPQVDLLIDVHRRFAAQAAFRS
jgi:galactonate dehydratase